MIQGFDDQRTLRPDLSEEWDFEKNKNTKITFVILAREGSAKAGKWVVLK